MNTSEFIFNLKKVCESLNIKNIEEIYDIGTKPNSISNIILKAEKLNKKYLKENIDFLKNKYNSLTYEERLKITFDLEYLLKKIRKN